MQLENLLQAHMITKVSLLDQISRPFGQTAAKAVPALEFSVPRKATSTYVSTVAVTFDKCWTFEMASFLLFVAYYS